MRCVDGAFHTKLRIDYIWRPYTGRSGWLSFRNLLVLGASKSMKIAQGTMLQPRWYREHKRTVNRHIKRGRQAEKNIALCKFPERICPLRIHHIHLHMRNLFVAGMWPIISTVLSFFRNSLMKNGSNGYSLCLDCAVTFDVLSAVRTQPYRCPMLATSGIRWIFIPYPQHVQRTTRTQTLCGLAARVLVSWNWNKCSKFIFYFI